MDSVALALFRFFSRTRQKAGAAVRAPGAAPHPHPHECNYDPFFMFELSTVDIFQTRVIGLQLWMMLVPYVV